MLRKVHIFRGGDTISSSGKRLTYSKEMLQEIVDSYNPTIHEGPVVFGHSGDNRIHFSQPIDGKPAGGWIKRLVREGIDLYAEIETTPLGEQAISDKLYKKVSASFYSPDMATNPSPGKWSLRHVALLGAEPPAIKGLKNFVYAEQEKDEEELTFLLDEEFAPTKISELSPIEQLRELYQKYQEKKAKEEAKVKNEMAQKAIDEAITNKVVSDTPVEPDGDGPNPENVAQNSEFMEQLELINTYNEVKELLMTTKLEYGCGDKKKKGMHTYEEDEKVTKSDMEDDDYMEDEEHMEGYGSKKKSAKFKKEDEEEEMDDKEYSEEDTEFKDPVSHDRKIKKPSDKALLEDLDEVGTTDEDLEEDKHSTGESDQDPYHDEDEELEGTSDVVEGRDHDKDGNDKGAQKKDKAGYGTGKALHSDDYAELMVIEEEIFQYAEGKGCPDGEKMVFGVCRRVDGTKTDNEKSLEEKARAGGSDPKGNKPVTINGKKYGWAIRNGKPMLVAWGSVAGEKISKNDPRAKDAPIIGKDGKEYDKKGNVINEGKKEYSEKEEVLLGNNNYTELSAKLEALEKQLKAEQAKTAVLEREKTVKTFQEFAEKLYNRGSLTESLIPRQNLVELLTKLQFNEIEFSEDSSPALEVMAVLDRLPQMVDFEDYSEEDLKPIQDETDPVARATALSEEKGIDFSEAIKYVLYPQEIK